MVLGAAVGFELLQVLLADRHARVEDLAVKVAGAACGVGAALSAGRHWQRFPWLARINQNSNHRG
jgi:hypothetical protein